MSLVYVLVLASGVFWTITYILVIRQAFRDRIYAMPLLAMSMNLAWEFLFTFVYPSIGGQIQEGFNLLWFALDLGILYTYIRFWRADYPKHLSPKLMVPLLILTFAACTPIFIAIVKHFGQDAGSVYTAYGDNLIMSVLFMTMLIRRGDRRGQSLWIAWGKLLGTAAASLSQYLDQTNALWNVLFIEIFAFDLLYVVMLARSPRYIAE